MHDCQIRSCVTDNDANMVRMRTMLRDEMDVLSYGCSAHAFNQLADVMKIQNFDQVSQHVVQIIKYFRHHHLPKAWLKEAGGKENIYIYL